MKAPAPPVDQYNILSSADSWLHVFERLSIGAGVLTVAALIGIAVTSRIVSLQNALEFERVKGTVAKQQERAAKAETALKRFQTVNSDTGKIGGDT